MKVLLLNGSPNKQGCTYTALKEIANTLKEEGIETEIYHIGTDAIASCRGCRACTQTGKCVIKDKVNDFVDYAAIFDGFIFGSPVHYAAISGGLGAFLDRAFFSASMSGRGHIFKHKPASAIVSGRRAGTTAALEQLNKYFTISQMPIVSGRYWNMVHGSNPDEVKKDLEGMQNMRFLARNMAWQLKCIEAGAKAGIEPPKQEEVIYTNYIR